MGCRCKSIGALRARSLDALRSVFHTNGQFLKSGRVLGDDVEGVFEGEAGAAERAFFEEAAD